MNTFKHNSPHCPHGSLLSCPKCMHFLIRTLLTDLFELVHAAECDGLAEFESCLYRAAQSLQPCGLTLKADAEIESELEQRLLG